MPKTAGGRADFLKEDKDMNDPAVLRKMVRDLEIENKQLKEENKGNDYGRT